MHVLIIVVLAEITWINSLHSKLWISSTISKIYFDNLGDVLLVDNPVMHSKSKHFELLFVIK